MPAESVGVRAGPAAPFLGQLRPFLLADGGDEFAQVKRLHDWLADNIAYDVDGLLGRTPIASGLDAVLHSGRWVCQGYAELFAEMCRLGGSKRVFTFIAVASGIRRPQGEAEAA